MGKKKKGKKKAAAKKLKKAELRVETFGRKSETPADEKKYEAIIREAAFRSEDFRTGTRVSLTSLKLMVQAFFADPQAVIDQSFHETDRNTAYLSFALSLLIVFLTGLKWKGVQTGFRITLFSALIQCIYPCLCALTLNTSTPIRPDALFSVFFTARTFIYILLLPIMLLMYMDFPAASLLMLLVLLPACFIFDYMAVLTITNHNSRFAMKSAVFAAIGEMVIFVAAIFVVFSVMIMKSALSDLLKSGDPSAIISFFSKIF